MCRKDEYQVNKVPVLLKKKYNEEYWRMRNNNGKKGIPEEKILILRTEQGGAPM